MKHTQKILTPAELYDLQQFVLDVLSTIKYDDTGVTDDLIDGAETAAEILGVNQKQEEEDDEQTPIDS